MKDLLLMLAHLLTTLAKLLGPGGAKAIVADSLLMKQQLLIINRSRRRAPNLTPIDRILLGFWSLFLNPHHIQRAAVILRPSTLLNFHDMLKKRKYRLLYTSRRKGKPGPKGPSQELIDAIVEMKRRNSRFGCPRIAQEINKAFGVGRQELHALAGHVVKIGGWRSDDFAAAIRAKHAPADVVAQHHYYVWLFAKLFLQRCEFYS
jgi:hypothetical protein